jgi:hypothetical protein
MAPGELAKGGKFVKDLCFPTIETPRFYFSILFRNIPKYLINAEQMQTDSGRSPLTMDSGEGRLQRHVQG